MFECGQLVHLILICGGKYFHVWENLSRLVVKLNVWAMSPQLRSLSREKFRNMFSCQKENPQTHGAKAREGSLIIWFKAYRLTRKIMNCDCGIWWMMDLGCDEKNDGQVFGTAGYDSFLSTFQFGILGQATLTWGWRWEDVFSIVVEWNVIWD